MKIKDILIEGVTQENIADVYNEMPKHNLETYENGELLELSVSFDSEDVLNELSKVVVSIEKLKEFILAYGYDHEPEDNVYDISCMSEALLSEDNYNGSHIRYSDGSYRHDCEEGIFYIVD